MKTYIACVTSLLLVAFFCAANACLDFLSNPTRAGDEVALSQDEKAAIYGGDWGISPNRSCSTLDRCKDDLTCPNGNVITCKKLKSDQVAEKRYDQVCLGPVDPAFPTCERNLDQGTCSITYECEWQGAMGCVRDTTSIIDTAFGPKGCFIY